MPTYTYKARDANGKMITGQLEVESEADIKANLKARSLIPIQITPVTAMNKDLKDLTIFQPKVNLKDIALFCRQFAVIIEAGIAISTALDILRKQTENSTLKGITAKIYEEVQKGRGLSECMGEYEEFPSLLVNMVEAGEVSGTLDRVMNQMAVQYEKEMKTQQKIKGAMTYPIIVSVLMVVVVTILLVYVLPMFTSMFEDAGAQLPAATVMLIDLSKFLREKWYLALGFIGGGALLLRFVIKQPYGRRWMDTIAFRSPIFGPVNRKIATARFARTLSTLLGAGIPIIPALEVVKKVVQNTLAIEVIDTAAEEIQQGGNLADTLEQSDIFPPILVSMVRIGEEAGSLDTMMHKTADFYDDEVAAAVQQMTTMIEPAITLVMGVVIGFIMMAIIMPVFDLATQVG